MNNSSDSLRLTLNSVKVENCVLSRQTRVAEGATLKDCESRPGAEVIAKGARRSKPYVYQGVLTPKVCSFIQWRSSGWDGRYDEYFKRSVNLDKVLLVIFPDWVCFLLCTLHRNGHNIV